MKEKAKKVKDFKMRSRGSARVGKMKVKVIFFSRDIIVTTHERSKLSVFR